MNFRSEGFPSPSCYADSNGYILFNLSPIFRKLIEGSFHPIIIIVTAFHRRVQVEARK